MKSVITKLLTPRRAEAACPTPRLRQLVTFDKLCGQVGRNYKLSNPLSIGNSLGNIAVVVKGYFNLSAVVAVNYTHLVCRRKPLLGCKSASGVD